MSDDKEENPRTAIIVDILSAVGVILVVLILFLVAIRNQPSPAPVLPSDTLISMASPSPRPTTPTASQIPSPQPILPASTGGTNWAISFEYHFPAAYWLAGKHQYTLAISCPSVQGLQDRNGTWTNSFSVSTLAPLFSGDVYLELGGISSIVHFSQPPSAISDSQTTTADLSMTGLTYAQADWYSRNCTATIQPDSGAILPLSAGVPYQP